MSHDTFLARQPLVDTQHNLIGHELLFRASARADSADIEGLSGRSLGNGNHSL